MRTATKAEFSHLPRLTGMKAGDCRAVFDEACFNSGPIGWLFIRAKRLDRLQ